MAPCLDIKVYQMQHTGATVTAPNVTGRSKNHVVKKIKTRSPARSMTASTTHRWSHPAVVGVGVEVPGDCGEFADRQTVAAAVMTVADPQTAAAAAWAPSCTTARWTCA